jgi:hypothetical protein
MSELYTIYWELVFKLEPDKSKRYYATLHVVDTAFFFFYAYRSSKISDYKFRKFELPYSRPW